MPPAGRLSGNSSLCTNAKMQYTDVNENGRELGWSSPKSFYSTIRWDKSKNWPIILIPLIDWM